MIYITRRALFSAAHKLFKADWSEEKNREVFGKCANPNWHGHNYILYVTVKGEPDPGTGFLVNLTRVSEVIRTHITEKLDHRNVNLDVDFMKDIPATTENIAMAIWKQLEQPLTAIGCTLHCVKLQETENNCVEYFGA